MSIVAPGRASGVHEAVVVAKSLAVIPTGEFLSALHHYGVLLVRGEAVDEQALVETGARLGPLGLVFPASHRLVGHGTIRLQTNIPGLGANGGGEYWHADGPWKPDPGATLLRCVEASAGSGATLFADMRLAWDNLDEDIRGRLRELHGWYPIRTTYLDECRARGKAPDEGRLASLQDLHHPIVRRHPVTGRDSLYLNQEGLAGVDGIGVAEGAALLDRLYAHATQDAFIYRHEWSVGDVLLWDNGCVMHRALPSAPPTRKVTHRVTTNGFHVVSGGSRSSVRSGGTGA